MRSAALSGSRPSQFECRALPDCDVDPSVALTLRPGALWTSHASGPDSSGDGNKVSTLCLLEVRTGAMGAESIVRYGTRHEQYQPVTRVNDGRAEAGERQPAAGRT